MENKPNVFSSHDCVFKELGCDEHLLRSECHLLVKLVTAAHVTSAENQPSRTLCTSKYPRLKAKVYAC